MNSTKSTNHSVSTQSPPNLILENSEAPSRDADDLTVTRPQKPPSGLASLWTLKNKATLIAVALGTLPVLIIGGVSTYIASEQLSEDVLNEQQQFANAISLQMQDFDNRRRREAETLREAAGEEIPIEEKILGLNEANELSTLINERIATLRENTNEAEESLQFTVVDEDTNRVVISNNMDSIGQQIGEVFPGYESLKESEAATTVRDTFAASDQMNLITYAPVVQPASTDEDMGVLVYQPMSEAFAAQKSLQLTLLGGTVLTVLLVSTIAAYLANRATQPIIDASKAVEKLGQGKFNTRLNMKGNDELAVLSSNINVMAEQLEYQLEFIEDTAQRQNLFQTQATLVAQQQQKRQKLQGEVRSLLQSIEPAAQGDLTVQAAVGEGDLGAIAHTFNTLIASLRGIVAQAQQTTSQINSALVDQAPPTDSIRDFSHILSDIKQLSIDIQTVTTSAQQAEKVSRSTAVLAQESSQSVDRSAQNIAGFQDGLGETMSRIKHLGSAAQQISQVISLINEIALKTNLIAINTRIDQKIELQQPDGEEPADLVNTSEIGQLTEQSTRATREIDRIVKSIQSEIKEIISDLETNARQSADSAASIKEIKACFVDITDSTQELDALMRTISKATITQSMTSIKMGDAVEQISSGSQQASAAAKQADANRQDVVDAADKLASTIEQFRVTR